MNSNKLELTQNLDKIDLPKRFLDKLRFDLEYIETKELGDSLYMIVLFGSCAKGTYNICSDLDIMIVTNLEINQELKGDIASMLEEKKAEVSTDVKFYTKDSLFNGTSNFIKEVRKSGKILWRTKI